jgi:hypothetical protein
VSTAAIDAMFAARAYDESRVFRRANLRHIHLTDTPLGVCIWRLGGERFRAAAVAWGPLGGEFQIAVAGEPRNRDLYFAALAPFARDLCDELRRRAASLVARQRGKQTDFIPGDAVQIVVPNRANANALGLLGRYLGYLSDRGGVEPDPQLVEAGKHLGFYGRHARVPGQSLLLPLDRVLSEHWAPLMSPFEEANLAALDAQIGPPAGVHPFEAGVLAESALPLGPEPTEDIDRVTEQLLNRFNEARGGSTDPAIIAPLLGPMQDHYRSLVEPIWDLMGRAVDRERGYASAPSVARRFEVDREAFGRHVIWVSDGGRYKTRDSARQAVMSLRRLEDAQSLYEAERAVEDPACMVPYLLAGKAIRGEVQSIVEAPVRVKIRAVPRAMITVDTDWPVVLPVGKRLWWTATADDHAWEVLDVSAQGPGSRVTMMLNAKPTQARLPEVGGLATFSVLHTAADAFRLTPPREAPWTHSSGQQPLQQPTDIDDSGGEAALVEVEGA